MKIVWSIQIDIILSVGHSLAEMGVNNWALKKRAALGALDRLLELQIPVLGGDVCEWGVDRIEYNYDNWHCDQVQGESNAEFVVRSIEKAREYIENYQARDLDNLFFVFVPQV